MAGYLHRCWYGPWLFEMCTGSLAGCAVPRLASRLKGALAHSFRGTIGPPAYWCDVLLCRSVVCSSLARCGALDPPYGWGEVHATSGSLSLWGPVTVRLLEGRGVVYAGAHCLPA